MAPWGASLRPHGTFYRSLSFELDSAGNTIRPKPKRQKDKDAKEKSRKDKHPRFSPHKNNNSSTNNSNAGDGGEGRMMAMSSSSAMLSPRRTTQLQQLQQHPLSGSLSSLSSDDETPKDRPRMRKKTKGSSDKGTTPPHQSHTSLSLSLSFASVCATLSRDGTRTRGRLVAAYVVNVFSHYRTHSRQTCFPLFSLYGFIMSFYGRALSFRFSLFAVRNHAPLLCVLMSSGIGCR
jgi:hypothetical protein